MRLTVAFWLALWPVVSSAHHSISHTGPTFEVRGEVVRVVWANPHPRLTIRTDDLTGEVELMRLEGYGLGNLTRIGVRPDVIKIGDLVTVAVREANLSSRYLMQNILLPNDQELVMTGEPRWSRNYEKLTNLPDNLQVDTTNIATSRAQAQGIFRVWSFEERDFPRANDLPRTDAALNTQAAFNLDTDYPIMRCEPPGMPRVMIGNAWPIEFLQRSDGDIEIRMEEFDVVRKIYMPPTEESERIVTEVAPSPLGYSVGYWGNDNRLVVRTTRLNWPYQSSYLPQSDETETEEIFTLSDGDDRLFYEITITDPVNFTGPVSGTMSWRWVPGQEIRPYECQPYE